MDHATQVKLIDQVLDLVERGSTDMAEEEYRNPVSRYTDPERYRREVSRLLKRRPLACGHVSEFTEVGQFKTFEVGDVPILLVRGRDEIHAFANVCRHRGTKLVDDRRGKRRSFACAYHSWVYGPDGELRSVPDAVGFPSVEANRGGFGLTPLWSAVRDGFVYVQAEGSPEVDLDEWLGGLSHDLREIGLADYRVFSPNFHSYEANWKLPFDIFLENYHTKFAHKNTIYPVFISNVAKFDRLGAGHARCVLPKRSIVELRDLDRSEWSLIDQSTILYTIFPNTMVAVLPEHAAVWHVYPDDVSHCTLDFYTLISKRASTPEAKAEWEKSLVVVGRVEQEDIGRALAIQKGLRSGGNESFLFGRFERAIGWYHDSIEAAIA